MHNKVQEQAGCAHLFACKAVLLTAGGVHRNVELSKDTEVQLYSKDVAKASDDVCQQCYDSECSATEVSSPVWLLVS